MKKKKLLAAMLMCTAFTINTQSIAAIHETNVSEVVNKTYDGYVTPGEGGAISNTISSVIKESTFINNQALSSGSGGAVDLNISNGTTVEIIDSTFDNNYSNWSGGALIQRRPAPPTATSYLTVSGGSFTNNTTEYEGGAIFAGSHAIIDGVLFEGNKTKSINWGDRYSTADDGGGGAIFVGSAAQVSINNSEFNSNESGTVGGAVALRNDSKNDGSTTLDVKNSNFTGNKAGFDGGAIASFVDFTVSNSTFEGNHAGRNGGAISIDLKTREGSNGSIFENLTFNNNTAERSGGAINADSDITIKNSVFTNNSSGEEGGAVNSTGNLNIDNAVFSGNHTLYEGGAVKQKGENLTFTINNSTFNSNYNTDERYGYGGALYTQGSIKGTITNTVFEENIAARRGGAVMVGTGSSVDFTNTSFTNNQVNTNEEYDSTGGAVYIGTDTNVIISSSSFENNKSETGGGAVYQQNDSKSLAIKDSAFKNNNTVGEGGAVWLGNKSTVENSVFEGNMSTGTNLENTPNYETDDEGGGAIFIGGSAKTTITGSSFINNQSGTVGGAIATRTNAKNDGTTSLDIISSHFDGNMARVNGGAVATYIDATVTDTSFTNNTAGANGGAVWADKNFTVNAQNANVVLSGNQAADGSDIYMNSANSNLNLNAAEGKSITIASGISGNETGYNMIVNEDTSNTGSIVINSVIKNASIDVQNGTFHLAQGSDLSNSSLNMAEGTILNTIDNEINTFGENITIADNATLAVDVNLANGKGDNFANANLSGKVTITDVNSIANTTQNNVSINLYDALGLRADQVSLSDALLSQTQTVLTPIRYLQGGVSADGMMTFAPTGNGYRDFNPSIMASPVAAQLGGYLTQLNSYDEALRNMDMYMLMTKKQREALKLRNKYAAADGNLLYDPTGKRYDDKAAWFRPYGTFESVSLKGGPKVSNVAYGSFFGGESELHDLGHGWDGMYGVYVGYNGSHQAYDGIGIYQNGGTLGAVGMAIKVTSSQD